MYKTVKQKKSLVLLQQTVATLGYNNNKKIAVVSFPFPYNYGTVIVHEVQQAVHVTKGGPIQLESVEMSQHQQFRLAGKTTGEKHAGERRRAGTSAGPAWANQCALWGGMLCVAHALLM